jgi:hypothetical protein
MQLWVGQTQLYQKCGRVKVCGRRGRYLPLSQFQVHLGQLRPLQPNRPPVLATPYIRANCAS